MIHCTNKAGEHYYADKNKQWQSVSEVEMKKFLALLMYFGLVSYPSIKKYWSKEAKYSNLFVRSIMPRNRFEEIMRFIHFSHEDNRPEDRLKKVHDLVCLLNDKFQYYCSPNEDVVIDETMVPFRGRLKFRQYLRGKSHKYGVKLYKACGADGYTYRVKIYSGKEEVHRPAP